MLTSIIINWGTKKTVVWNTSQRPEIIGREVRKTKHMGGYTNILDVLVPLRLDSFLHGVSKVQKIVDAPLNPMYSFLLARVLHTLDVRMQRHRENAIAVERMLEDHSMVAEVYYTGLESHPDRYMADLMFQSGRNCEEDREYMYHTHGGMLYFVVTGEDNTEALRRARNACGNLRVINLAISLGGVRIYVQASGVHDSRHDTPREEDEWRVEGRVHMSEERCG